MVHVTLIHGINEGLTDPSWPWNLVGHSLNRGVSASFQTEHYWAGATPIWNHFVTNPKYGKTLAKRELIFQKQHPSKISIVGHSNGTNIGAHMIRNLVKEGFTIDKFILFGSTIHSDVEKSGLADLPINQCIAYCSPKDIVAKYLQKTPKFYGSLGAQGFTRNKKEAGVRIKEFAPIDSEWGNNKQKFITRWFPDFGHSYYFDPRVSELIYDCILEDLELKKRDYII